MHQYYPRGAPLLMVVVVVLCSLASARNDEHRGGMYATKLLDHNAVVDCVLTIADRNHDTRLNYAELEYALETYVTPFERMEAGLYARELIRHCDFDGNGYIELSELQRRPFCLSIAQHEALVRFMCNRALHTNSAYVDYIRHTQAVGAIIANQSVAQMVHAADSLMQKAIAPAVVNDRVDTPRAETDALFNSGLNAFWVVLSFFMLPALLCWICICIV